MRLIDADRLMGDFLCTFYNDLDDQNRTEKLINEAQTVEERPHGEWVWKKDKDSLRTYDLLCSKCGCKIFTCENYDSIEQAQKTVDDLVKDGKKIPNYCSDCGSDNRKKGEKDEQNLSE